MAEAEPVGGGNDADRPAPRPLDYPSPSLSSFDRPIEPVVQLAHGVRLAVRITYVVAAVMGLVFVVWAVLQLRSAFDAMGR